MPRYIDSDVLLAKYKAIISDHIIDKWNEKAAPASWAHAYLDFIDDIENVPTADVAPVRHGRWIVEKGSGEYAVCSECKGKSGTQWDGVEPIPLMTRYCPHCGARMDGGENDETDV